MVFALESCLAHSYHAQNFCRGMLAPLSPLTSTSSCHVWQQCAPQAGRQRPHIEFQEFFACCSHLEQLKPQAKPAIMIGKSGVKLHEEPHAGTAADITCIWCRTSLAPLYAIHRMVCVREVPNWSPSHAQITWTLWITYLPLPPTPSASASGIC